VSLAPAKTELDRALALDIVRVTEATAVAAALWRGRGNEAAADEAAATAMYRELARLPIEGVVVVGEGEENETPLLYIGETVGAGGPNPLKVDLAVDPVEGSTLCAKALPNALSVLAVAARGSLLKVPTMYMDSANGISQRGYVMDDDTTVNVVTDEERRRLEDARVAARTDWIGRVNGAWKKPKTNDAATAAAAAAATAGIADTRERAFAAYEHRLTNKWRGAR